jgi:hypothetical protein
VADREDWYRAAGEPMPKPLYRLLRRYALQQQQTLRLGHWDYDVEPTYLQADERANAQTFLLDEGDWARVRFRDDVGDWPGDALRQTIAHELLHLFVDRWYGLAERAVRAGLGQAAYDLWLEESRLDMERTVDRIAYAVAPLLPLPKK